VRSFLASCYWSRSSFLPNDITENCRSKNNYITSLPLFTIFPILAFQAELDATGRDAHPSEHSAYRGHRQALEMYAFALEWFTEAADRIRKSGDAGGGETVGPTAAKKVLHSCSTVFLLFTFLT
jgi:hypothetical protein